jgi:transposase
MFIDDSTYTRNGKTYRRVLLRNSYRLNGHVRHDTLANLSHCDDEEITAMKFALRHKTELNTCAPLAKHITLQQGLAIGAVWVFAHLAKQLGITQALGKTREAKLSLWLVMATLIGAGSRLSAVRLAQRHAVCDVLTLEAFNEDDLYQTMDWLASRQHIVEKRLFAHRYAEKPPTLYLYDVTSSYLEGCRNDLGAFGHNRDKKKGKRQIVIGLLTDDVGWPISVDVFRGNTADPTTVAPQILALAKRFGVTHVTFVGDRGMVKSGPIEVLQGKEFHYITAITRAQIDKLLREQVLLLSLFDETLCEVIPSEQEGEQTFRRYILRRNPLRAKELEATRDEKLSVVQTLVAHKNRYLKDHPRAQVATALREVETKAQTLKLSAWTRVTATERTLTLETDSNKRAERARLDGCYVITSDLPVDDADAATIHARYKDLKEVEWAFRTMKTTLLEMRGIYVRTEQHTRAHVFVVMLAYLIAYELRRKWIDLEMTVEEGIAELSSMSSILIDTAGVSCQTIPEPRSYGQQLLNALNITLPDAISHRGVNVAPRTQIKGTRRKQ